MYAHIYMYIYICIHIYFRLYVCMHRHLHTNMYDCTISLTRLPSLSQPLSLYRSLSDSRARFLSLTLSLTHTHTRTLSVSLTVSLFHFHCLSLSLPVPLSLCLALPLPISLYVRIRRETLEMRRCLTVQSAPQTGMPCARISASCSRDVRIAVTCAYGRSALPPRACSTVS